MEYCENDDDNFTNLKTEYPAKVFNDTYDGALSCETTASPLVNNEIDFKISFDESNDEDYMVIFDENSFSCKIIYVNNLKNDFEDENDKVNMRSSLSPEPTFGYIDDLDFLKYFENEFPAIAYNDLKSKSNPLIETFVEGYDEGIIHNYEKRLETIWGRSVNWVQVLDFAGLTNGMRQTLRDKLSMTYTEDDRQALFTSHAWRRLFEIRGPLVREFMLEFFSTCRMDNPNITMEEYTRLQEKARKHRKVFNWETAKYGKIWYDEYVHDLRSVETECLAIVFNDNLTLNETLSCEPTVSSLNNNEIDFRISFDESDDEDYTVIFNKNLFSYKIISANDLKTNSENDNKKVNMPLFPSLEPKVSCIDDLDFIKDFKNEFPAIVYNDALTFKSNFSTEPTLCPQHIDEFDLNNETSLSEYDEDEQNILYFIDLFPFNIIYHDDLMSGKDNDDTVFEE
nr:hypothetical protein [Tanacetum cinerariifolium]